MAQPFVTIRNMKKIVAVMLAFVLVMPTTALANEDETKAASTKVPEEPTQRRLQHPQWQQLNLPQAQPAIPQANPAMPTPVSLSDRGFPAELLSGIGPMRFRDATTWKAWVEAELPEPEPLTELELWVEGFLSTGAPEYMVDPFVRKGGIIDCESSYRSSVVRAGADWGFVQANRAAHRRWWEPIYGKWEDTILDPFLNGVFAGTLVNWKLGSGRAPLEDWFKSQDCHGIAYKHF